MHRRKVHIIDQNVHRRALYAYYVELAGYDATPINHNLSNGRALEHSQCLVVSLPVNLEERAGLLRSLSTCPVNKPMFVLDSVAFAHQDFKDFSLIGHVNRRELSLLPTLKELVDSLGNLAK